MKIENNFEVELKNKITNLKRDILSHNIADELEVNDKDLNEYLLLLQTKYSEIQTSNIRNQTNHLQTIKNCVLFFTIIGGIGLALGVIAIILSF